MDKKKLRYSILEKRDKLSQENRKYKDSKIFDKLQRLKEYQEAKNIFSFISFGSEVDTYGIIRAALDSGKTVVVPWINKKTKSMEAKIIYSLEDMIPGHYGILEPKEEAQVMDAKDIDFIIMPGVAFDINGGRIGYGGGYYDKYLGSLDRYIPKVALCYDLQLLQEPLPLEPFDIKIDGVITETQELWFNN